MCSVKSSYHCARLIRAIWDQSGCIESAADLQQFRADFIEIKKTNTYCLLSSDGKIRINQQFAQCLTDAHQKLKGE